jgi:hypothetical protein
VRRPALALGLALLAAAACSAFGSEPAGQPDASDASPDSTAAAGGDGSALDADGAGADTYAALIASHRPLAYWRMGTRSGPIVRDETGRGNDLVLVASPKLGLPGTIVGDPDTALGFEQGAYAVATDAGALSFASEDGGVVEYSLEAWVRPAKSIDGLCSNNCFYQYLISNWDGAEGYYVFFSFYDAPPGASFFHSHEGRSAAAYASAPAPDAWSHVVAVRAQRQLMMYVNGVPGSGDTSDLPLAQRSIELRIAVRSNGNSSYFVGAVDEVAIYDRALTVREVEEHYAKGAGR